MATSSTRLAIITIVFSLFCCQASAFPSPVKLLLEPFLLDLRVRAASALNEAGIGIGGFISTIGLTFYNVAKFIGDNGARILIATSGIFTDPRKEVSDTPMAFKLKRLKTQELAQQGFSNRPSFTKQWKKWPNPPHHGRGIFNQLVV